VTAIGLAPGMIEKARRRPEAVDWLVGDVRELPFPDGAFEGEVVALYERHRAGGGVSYPREYLLAYGEKR
jgi:hypothetical protein